MDIKEQLPKIGKDVNGHVEFEENVPIKKCTRPDYKALSSQKYQDEETCVEFIIGLRQPSLIYAGAEWAQTKSLEKKEGTGVYPDIDAKKYIRSSEVTGLLLEIKHIIDIGVMTKEILSYTMDDKNQPDDSEKRLFSIYKYYHLLSFLNWMKKNSFPIPDELVFHKNKDGELQWGEEAGPQPDDKPMDSKLTIPVPGGTTWTQIHFRLVNPSRIEITTPVEMMPYSPHQLGLKKKPKLYELFETLAEDQEYYNGDKSDFSRLRKHIQGLFPTIPDDPLPYEKRRGYRTAFHLRIFEKKYTKS
ncbi:MAG: hypothetical protein KKF12_12220 [Proteobacteria bacterium]|nr:hypothetical protein [Desulfobacula sp.]MBU3951010.1 hypothetical protein [Pseudomonadota bacterium]MBU4131578.1 hypothetical protein [Pseudomonadota bacterium]